ncbi:MAG: hypothetical protein JSR61_02980 [Proteobacteria bacterium]|nr:hypothetical protein [Pseudomonadota bacterium]
MARSSMWITALAAVTLTAAVPAFAGNYPISGRWGVSASTAPGPIDCTKLRVITFNGNQRTDTGGGVPAYRNRTITDDGLSQWRVIDEFTTGQISNAQARYTLKLDGTDRAEMNLQPGGLVKLRKCK